MDGITLLPEHLSWMRRSGRAETTLRARRVAVVRLAESLDDDPAEATFEHLDGWQARLASLASLRWHTAMIRPYYRYLQARGVRRDNPAALLPIPSEPRRLPRPIAEDRLAHAIAHAPSRVLPWLLLGGWVGLRAVEISRLDVEDFVRDMEGHMWAVVIGKGSHERHVPIPEWLWTTLERDLPESGPCFRYVRGPGAGIDRVTPQQVSQYCNEYLHKAGIPDTLHSLRHRIATLVLEQSGGDIRLVQSLLGHLSIATTALYTQVAPRRLADSVDDVAPPRTSVNRRRRRGDLDIA